MMAQQTLNSMHGRRNIAESGFFFTVVMIMNQRTIGPVNAHLISGSRFH